MSCSLCSLSKRTKSLSTRRRCELQMAGSTYITVHTDVPSSLWCFSIRFEFEMNRISNSTTLLVYSCNKNNYWKGDRTKTRLNLSQSCYIHFHYFITGWNKFKAHWQYPRRGSCQSVHSGNASTLFSTVTISFIAGTFNTFCMRAKPVYTINVGYKFPLDASYFIRILDKLPRHLKLRAGLRAKRDLEYVGPKFTFRQPREVVNVSKRPFMAFQCGVILFYDVVDWVENKLSKRSCEPSLTIVRLRLKAWTILKTDIGVFTGSIVRYYVADKAVSISGSCDSAFAPHIG